MVDDVELPWGTLAADVEIKHGQIRLRNVLHGEPLTSHFIVTPSPRHLVDLSPGRRSMGPCDCITVGSHHAQVAHEHWVVALATRAMP